MRQHAEAMRALRRGHHSRARRTGGRQTRGRHACIGTAPRETKVLLADHAVHHHAFVCRCGKDAGTQAVAFGSVTGETERMRAVGLDDAAVLKARPSLAARLAQMLYTHLPPPSAAIVSGVRDR